MRNEGETVIIRQREKGRPTVSNRCSLDGKWRRWILLSLPNFPFLSISFLLLPVPSIFVHTYSFSPCSFRFFASQFSLFSLFLWGIKTLADKTLCRPRSSVHVLEEATPFTHACVYSLHTRLCAIWMFLKDGHIYTHWDTARVCVAFLYRDWNIKQNWDYFQKEKEKGDQTTYHTLFWKTHSVCVKGRKCLCVWTCVSKNIFC